ncbi:MAG: hypothetical protein V4632_12440 [Pseudomonadota bacterium]
MKKAHHALFPLLLAMSVTGHAADDRVTMIYEAAATDEVPAVLAGACTLSIGAISDERNNKESVSADFGRVLSGDPVPWLGTAFDSLAAYGYKVVKGDKPARGGIVMHAAIKRSYVYHGPMRLNGVVALDTVLTLPSGEKLSRKYRASGSKTNMASMNSEYMTTLNYALNGLLGKMSADLESICKRTG